MKKEFKPLLYTTTLRNPGRCKDFLHLLTKFDGSILTDEIIREVERQLFRYGLYKPQFVPDSVATKWRNIKQGEISEMPLDEEETSRIYEMNDPARNPNIKGHKEKGFAKGWPSRFDTQFKMLKAFGFVWYEANSPIIISETGKLLAQSVSITTNGGLIERIITDPLKEQSAFLMAFAKQQRNNPFIRELNDNIPLILLLETINQLNKDSNFKDCGIAYREIPLLLCWRDNDSRKLYGRIKNLRNQYGYTYSDEVIQWICINEILGSYKSFKMKSLMQEYPDEFVRKMRMTGLVSFRGGGRFIDINRLESNTIGYILSTYTKYKKYESEREYFEYMSRPDPKLLRTSISSGSTSSASEKLASLLKAYPWNTIKHELGILEKKGASKHDVLKFISAPARLEFLIALAIKSRFPGIAVVPHYKADDEGLPVSTAPGGYGDIECSEYPNGVLVEVTMSEGRSQTMMEVWPIARHLEEYTEKGNFEDSECAFIAPSIFIDSQRQIDFLREKEKKRIIPHSITGFTQYLENTEHLFHG